MRDSVSQIHDDLFFIDLEHRRNYKEMLLRFPDGRTDCEYRVGCYILSHPAIYPDAQKYFDEFFNFHKLLEQEPLAVGFRKLIDLGYHLYGGGHHPFNLSDALALWDSNLYMMSFQAISIVRKGYMLSY
jgi:hypothetical protein